MVEKRALASWWQAVVLVYDRLKSAAFPMERVVKLDILENSRIQWLFRDPAFAHSTLLATSAFKDYHLSQPLSRTTLFHLKRTLRHLNKQLSDESAYQSESVIYTIVTLAVLALMFGDPSATRTHMAGLQRIVQLRGGESCFSTSSKQHFMLERQVLAPSLQSAGADTSQLGVPVIRIDDLVDSRLATVFYDLRRLAEILNTHGSQGGRMRGDVFQRVLVSTQRRLLWLQYMSIDGWSECLRLGMLAQLTATLQLAGREIDYSAPVCKIPGESSGAQSLQDGVADLIVVAAAGGLCPYTRVGGRATATGIVIWMNGVHEGPGKHAFEVLTR
ncbi:hypothetical protein LTR53_005195 [Teratosphaeriaceae sp. CCFEE 6253]|nr:hypothetical protein LTR53_005195 [Teratosphaeriaceae sp. CCFEE 6253]